MKSLQGLYQIFIMNIWRVNVMSSKIERDKQAQPLNFEGNWYKGNLHCHSTTSDGKHNYEELKAMYKSHGYAFLCHSDHERFTDVTYMNDEDFITIPTVEWSNSDDRRDNISYKTHHMLGIKGTKEMIANAKETPFVHDEKMPQYEWNGAITAQKMGKYLSDRGNIAIYNHPVWSRTNIDDFGDLGEFIGLEVYNYSCDVENKTGYSDIYWDDLLVSGKKLMGFATDDNHNTISCGDSFGGWICVKAKSLTHEDIVSSIVDGSFYASNGPEIHDLYIEDGVVHVECSPTERINFVSMGAVGTGYTLWKTDEPMTKASYKTKKAGGYVRVEIIDKNGKTAWSNPFYL